MNQQKSVDLEMARTQLENNVAKLQASLRHWQTWEIEYDSMKEQILGLDNDHTEANLQNIGNVPCDPLLGDSQNSLLTAKDVSQNVKTVASLLHTEEEKLAASAILSQVEINGEDALPLTDIHEELDEEGNVIASSTSVPNQSTPKIVEALRKAGLPLAQESGTRDSEKHRQSNGTIENLSEAEYNEVAAESGSHDLTSDEFDPSTTALNATTDDRQKGPAKPKKSVSFVEGTKAELPPPLHPKTVTTQDRTALLNKLIAEIDQKINNDAMVTRIKRICNEVNVLDLVLQEAIRPKRIGVAKVLVKRRNFQGVRRLFRREKLSRRQSTAERIVELMEENDRSVSTKTSSSLSTTKGEVHSGESAPNISPMSAQASDRKHQDIKDHLRREAQQIRELRESGEMRMDVFHEEVLQLEQIKYLLDEAVDNATTTTKQAKSIEEEETRTQDEPNQNSQDDETEPPQSHVIPAEESAEDAALRRQMIKYNMEEVGAVVAEMNIDDDDSGDIDFSSPEEEEDDFGRTSTRVLDDKYLAEMQALEKRLSARAMVNVGPEPDTTSETPSRNGKSANCTMSDGMDEKQRPAEKKSVRFADELDVQDIPLAALTNNLSPSTASAMGNPTQKAVVERTPQAKPLIDASHSPKKRVSRFKSARSKDSIDPSANSLRTIGQPTTNLNIPTNVATIDSSTPKPTLPTPPTTPHALKIIERPYTSAANPALSPAEPDELDPALLKQHVSTEYHRLRNRMIQREGGFLAHQEEQAEIPLTEEEGGPKRMSRFKAARLGQR